MGVPENIVGFQNARSGDGYVGFFALSLSQMNMREYLQVELTESLVYSIRYEVCFYVSLADKMRYAVNTLGAHMSDTAISRNDILRFEEIPQILNAPENPLTTRTDWVAICDTFTSRTGNERFLTIGNFHDDTESGLMFIDSVTDGLQYKSYYYIDDVSVIALDSIPDGVEEYGGLRFSVFPNPATEILHISSKHRLEHVRLLDNSGRAILTEKVTSQRHDVHLHGIPPGLYLLDVTDMDGRRAMQKVVVQ
jgi:hypothetical protein